MNRLPHTCSVLIRLVSELVARSAGGVFARFFFFKRKVYQMDEVRTVMIVEVPVLNMAPYLT